MTTRRLLQNSIPYKHIVCQESFLKTKNSNTQENSWSGIEPDKNEGGFRLW